MKKLAIVVAKFGLAGAVIFGIWLLALTQEPAEEIGEVKKAEADIGWGAVEDGREFTRAMEDLGLEARPYDLNGNVMYFANGVTNKTPGQVERIIQKTLVDHGVNSKDYSNEPPTSQHLMNTEFSSLEIPDRVEDLDFQALQDNTEKVAPYRESLTKGDVVPTQRGPRGFRMVGVDWREDPDDFVDKAKKTAASSPDFRPNALFGGYRFIEGNWDGTTGQTDVTAVWTGEDFDPDRMTGEAFVKQEPDPNVPSCMGCERDFRFQSLAPDEPLRANKWTTLSSPAETYMFYKRAMHARGWQESGVQPVLNEAARYIPELAAIDGRVLNLEKDGKSMQIVMVPESKGGTSIISQERYKDAHSTMKQRLQGGK